MYKNIFSALILATSYKAMAYETPTHAYITSKAFDFSVLKETSSGDLYFRLGFDGLSLNRPFDMQLQTPCVLDSFPTRDSYADPLPGWLAGANVPPDTQSVRFRCPNNYERLDMPVSYSGRIPTPGNPLGLSPELRFEAWLMRGVVREDDLALSSYPTPADAPDPDPYGTDIDRPRYHFYNPITNTADVLLTLGPSLGWALGETDPFAASQIPDPMRGNHFSYMDARRAFFLALTYKQPGTSSFNKSRIDSDARMALWGSTMKSIGHVSHLLQDQASPQHSRGERHNHVCNGWVGIANEDIATRTYENYTNYRLTYGYNVELAEKGVPYLATNACEEQAWLNMFRDGSARPEQAPTPINIWSVPYPIPKFSVQRKFFTTRFASDTASVSLPALNARAGLGDYANRGFYTQNNQQSNLPSPPIPQDPSFVAGPVARVTVPGLGVVNSRALYWPVPDPVNPNYPNPSLVSGRAPIVTRSELVDIGMIAPGGWNGTITLLSLQNYDQMADMLVPRAIAYTSGLINFFFRGKLEIEPIEQRIFALINQGEPHTINSDGYPIRTSDGKVFGFTKIRMKVRNVTEPIVESGTNQTVNQISGNGKLVAIARYHRNPCYKADLSGERAHLYAPVPQLIVTEPACAGTGIAAGTRTPYQEISVSVPLDITSASDLPGGAAVNPPTVEKVFDFSMDPIPVNATDLFIQVVYRGQLGDETDGIAVGNYDLREPTFYAGWNNTDYAYNEVTTLWQNAGGAFPARVMQGIRICAGTGAASKWIYQYNFNDPQPGLTFPFTGAPATPPGVLRLAFLFAKPTQMFQRVSFRSFPIMSIAPSAQVRLGSTAGQSRQASREVYEETGVNALPMPSNCDLNPPMEGANVWCFDPVLKRRGLAMGFMSHPLYYSTGFTGNNGPDVDAPPAQIPFMAQNIRTGGIVRFDDETPLQNCPAGPALLSPEQQRAIELREEAWELGIDLDAVVK